MSCHIHCTGMVVPQCASSYAVQGEKTVRIPCHIHRTGRAVPHSVSSYVLPFHFKSKKAEKIQKITYMASRDMYISNGSFNGPNLTEIQELTILKLQFPPKMSMYKN